MGEDLAQALQEVQEFNEQIMTEGPINAQQGPSLQQRALEVEKILQDSGLAGQQKYQDQIGIIMSLTQGNLTEENIEIAERKAQGLVTIHMDISNLESIGAEEMYIQASMAAFNDYGDKTETRATDIHQLADLRFQNDDILKSNLPGMQETKLQMDGLVTSLGVASIERREYNESLAQGVQQQIQEYRESIQEARVLQQQLQLHDISRMIQELEAMRNQRDSSKKYRESLDKFYKKAKEVQEKISKGEKVDAKEYSDIETAMAYVQRADAVLGSIESRSSTKVTSSVYANAIDALGAGNVEEAKVHFFLAEETAEASRTSRTERDTLAGISDRLSRGEISVAEAMSEMGTHYADQLQAQAKKAEKAGIKDEQIISSLAALSESLGSGNLTLEDLQRAKVAISMTKLLRKVPKMEKEAQEGAIGIFRRGFKALEMGLPLDYVKMQEKLAKMYIEAGDLVGEPASPDIKRSEIIKWRREEIEKASELLEQGQKLNAIHILVQHGLSPEEAAKRLFGRGEESKSVARLYNTLGDNVENEILRIAAYASLFTSAEEGLETFSKLNQKSLGQSVDYLVNTFYLGMEELMQKISGGEQLSDYEGVLLQGLPKLYEGSKEDVVDFFSVILGAPAAVPMTEGLVTVSEGLKGLKGEARQDAARIYAMAINDLNEGAPQNALIHMILAQAYAKGSKEDREAIMDLAIKLDDGEVGVQKASYLARVFFERSRMENADESQMETFRQYSDLAIAAYDNGDLNGADILGRLAILYGTASQFDPEEKAVMEILGIPEGKGDIPSLDEIKKGVLEGKSVLEVISLTPRDLEIFYLKLASLELSLSEIEFNGKIAMSKFDIDGSSSYASESKRLGSKQDDAEDPIEAGRLGRESEISKSEEMHLRLDDAKENYGQGAELIRQGIDKRTLAFSVGDEKIRAQMLTEAEALITKGQALITVAEGELKAIEEMHRSISGVKTLNRESGRSYLFLAYNTFDSVGDAILADEHVTDSEYQGHQLRMNQSYSDIGLGTFQINAQLSIQEIRNSLLAEGSRQTKLNESNDKKFGHVSLPNTPGEIGPTLPAYDKVERQKEIDKGITYAKRERFGSSATQFKISSSGMALDLQLVDISSKYWGLINGATEREKESGMDYFKTQELIGQVEAARSLAREGKIASAEKLMSEITSAAIVQGAQQGQNNKANMIRAYEALLRERAFQTLLWGLGILPEDVEAKDPETIKMLEKIEQVKSFGDPGKKSHMEIVMGIRGLGILQELADDQNAEADRFAALAEKTEKARDSIKTPADVVDSEVERNTIGYALFISLFNQYFDGEKRLRAKGMGTTWEQDVLHYHLEQMANDFDSGNYKDITAYLLKKPELMERAVNDLTNRGLSESIGLGLIVDSAFPKQVERYQNREIGWNFAMTLMGRALEMYDYADILYRARVDSPLGRDVIRYDAGDLLIAAYWASAYPQEVKQKIIDGSEATFYGVRDRFWFRKDSGVFEDVKLDFGAKSFYPDDILKAKTYRFYDHLQDISQGLGEAPEPTTAYGKALKKKMGDRMYFVMFERHEAAVEISNMDTTITMASLGFVRDNQGEWKHVKMSKEQQEVLQEAAATMAQIRGQYLNISTSLKRFTSYDDAREAFKVLNQLSGDISDIISPVLSGGDFDGEKVRAQVKTVTESRMETMEGHVEEGISDDTFLNYTEAGVKIIGAGFMTATGFGAPVAAFFLADSLHMFQESIIMAGGYDYMSTEQKVLNWGGVGLSALGFGVAGLSSISNTLRTTSTLASATKGFKILEGTIRYSGYGLIAGGIVMGGLQIYDLYAHNPDAGALDYGFAFFNAAQPFLQMGATRVVGLRPNLAFSNTFGAKSYRAFMAGVFGVGKGELVNAGLLSYNQKYAEAITKLSPDSRVQIDKIEGQINRRLDPGEVGAVLEYFSGKDMNALEAASVLKRYDEFVGQKIKETLTTDEALGTLVDIHRVRPLEAAETLLLLEKFGGKLPNPAEAIAFLDSYAKGSGEYFDILKFSKEYPDKGIYGDTSHRNPADEVTVINDVIRRFEAGESLNPFENKVVNRIDELVNVKGISRDSAIQYVAEERTNPHTVELSADITGMPQDFYSWTVPTVDGGEMRLGEAPRAVLHEFVGKGAGGHVFFGEMNVNGQKKEVAIKVFTNVEPAPDGAYDYPGRLAYDVQEMKSLKILSDLGLGPEVYGFVDVDGNYAIAMERIYGKAIDEMSPAEIRAYVTPDTYAQLREQWIKLTDAGYTIGDFQFAVLTKDQTINGVQRKAGDVVMWDAGALRSIKERGGEAHYTPDEVVSSARVTADLVLMDDYLGRIGPDERKILEGYAREVTGSGHRNGDYVIKQFLRMDQGKRNANASEYLNSLNDPALIEKLRMIEADSGVSILPQEGAGPEDGGGPKGGAPQTGGEVIDLSAKFEQKIVDNLELADPKKLTDLGARLLDKDGDIRAEAERQLESLGGHPAADVIREMIADADLIAAVESGDEVGLRRFLKNKAPDYASRVNGPENEPNQAVMVATGTDDVQAIGKVVDDAGHESESGTGQGIVAMMGDTEFKKLDVPGQILIEKGIMEGSFREMGEKKGLAFKAEVDGQKIEIVIDGSLTGNALKARIDQEIFNARIGIEKTRLAQAYETYSGKGYADQSDIAALEYINKCVALGDTKEDALIKAAHISTLSKSSFAGEEIGYPDKFMELRGNIRELMFEYPEAFLPSQTIEIDGQTIRIGKPMQLAGDTAVPVYVTKEDGTLQLNIAYKSESQGCWRRFAGSIKVTYKDKNKNIQTQTVYHKGRTDYNEHLQDFHWEIQKSLDAMESIEPIRIMKGGKMVQLKELNLSFYWDPQNLVGKENMDLSEGGARIDVEKLNVEDGLQERLIDKGSVIDFAKEENLPSTVIDFWSSGNAEGPYGKHMNVVMESSNGEYLYTIAVTEDGIFLKSVQNREGGVADCGSAWKAALVDAEGIFTPIVEYPTMVKKLPKELTEYFRSVEESWGRGKRVRIFMGLHDIESSPLFKVNNGMGELYPLLRMGKYEEVESRLNGMKNGEIPSLKEKHTGGLDMDVIEWISSSRFEIIRTAYEEYAAGKLNSTTEMGRQRMAELGISERELVFIDKAMGMNQTGRNNILVRMSINWAVDNARILHEGGLHKDVAQTIVSYKSFEIEYSELIRSFDNGAQAGYDSISNMRLARMYEIISENPNISKEQAAMTAIYDINAATKFISEIEDFNRSAADERQAISKNIIDLAKLASKNRSMEWNQLAVELVKERKLAQLSVPADMEVLEAMRMHELMQTPGVEEADAAVLAHEDVNAAMHYANVIHEYNSKPKSHVRVLNYDIMKICKENPDFSTYEAGIEYVKLRRRQGLPVLSE